MEGFRRKTSISEEKDKQKKIVDEKEGKIVRVVEFCKVTRTYKMGDTEIRALNQVSFDIERGKLTTILGPSGSGKSTTLNLIGGMDRPTDGNILIDGKDITGYDMNGLTRYRREEIGFVFQFYNLIPNLTAFENVDMACRLSKSAIKADVALERVGLIERRNNYPSQLSGGELQRVSIARALCKNPTLLLCDEPTGALDSETGKKILILLQEMAIKHGKTVVIVTHNSAIAPAADRVIRLHDGGIKEIRDNEVRQEIEKVEW